MSVYLSRLFLPRPEQWGLRGDPVLWGKLADALKLTPLPSTATELVGIVETSFLEITGFPLLGTQEILVESFPRNGMSGGYVCREFWIKTAIPLLLTRLAEISEEHRA
jgi:hypothetical protein